VIGGLSASAKSANVFSPGGIRLAGQAEVGLCTVRFHLAKASSRSPESPTYRVVSGHSKSLCGVLGLLLDGRSAVAGFANIPKDEAVRTISLSKARRLRVSSVA
jgi:hypothetical protein